MNAIGTYLRTKRFTWRIGRARSLPIIHRKGLDLCALDLQLDALAPDVVFRSPGPEIQSPLEALQGSGHAEALGQTVHPDQQSFDGVSTGLLGQGSYHSKWLNTKVTRKPTVITTPTTTPPSS